MDWNNIHSHSHRIISTQSFCAWKSIMERMHFLLLYCLLHYLFRGFGIENEKKKQLQIFWSMNDPITNEFLRVNSLLWFFLTFYVFGTKISQASKESKWTNFDKFRTESNFQWRSGPGFWYESQFSYGNWDLDSQIHCFMKNPLGIKIQKMGIPLIKIHYHKTMNLIVWIPIWFENSHTQTEWQSEIGPILTGNS